MPFAWHHPRGVAARYSCLRVPSMFLRIRNSRARRLVARHRPAGRRPIHYATPAPSRTNLSGRVRRHRPWRVPRAC